jgi:hypothetical protein
MNMHMYQVAVTCVADRPTVRVASPWLLNSVVTAQLPTTVGRPEVHS